jgi:hypothetical protein
MMSGGNVRQSKGTLAAAVASAGAVALATLLLAGQAAAGAPTKASWAAAANRACADNYATVRTLPKPTTHARLIAFLRGSARIEQQLTGQLARIPVPRAERQPIAKLLYVSRKEISLVKYRLLPAVLQGDFLLYQRTAVQLNPLGKLFNKLSRSLGARVCAEDVSPQG